MIFFKKKYAYNGKLVKWVDQSSGQITMQLMYLDVFKNGITYIISVIRYSCITFCKIIWYLLNLFWKKSLDFFFWMPLKLFRLNGVKEKFVGVLLSSRHESIRMIMMKKCARFSKKSETVSKWKKNVSISHHKFLF